MAFKNSKARSLATLSISKHRKLTRRADTLIVWTDNGVDMALSFQEADGCQSIWFVNNLDQSHAQTRSII